MKRLTEYESIGGHAHAAPVGNIDEALMRLAAYEDTELTPADVKSMCAEWEAMMSVLNAIGSYDRLRELAEADRDGRVVVLPCKVGATVYEIITIQAQKPVMLETQVKTLGQAADVAQLIGKKNKVINIFLTREEAEKALEEVNRVPSVVKVRKETAAALLNEYGAATDLTPEQSAISDASLVWNYINKTPDAPEKVRRAFDAVCERLKIPYVIDNAEN